MKRIIVLVGVVLAFGGGLVPKVMADQYWDGDNAVGNFSFNNNWFGDSQPAWGYGGSLHFNLNNGGATSLYNDYGGWNSTDYIAWDVGFPSGLTLNTAGNGLDFDTKIENNSSFAQVLNMPVSGAKNGSGTIEINPVNGDLTITNSVFNDNNKPFHVYGDNSKLLTIYSGLTGNTTVGMTIQQYSKVMFRAAQTWGSTSTFTVNEGELWLDVGGSLAVGSVNLGAANADTAKFYLSNTTGGLSSSRPITVANSGGTKVLGGLNTSGTQTFSGAVTLNGEAQFEAQTGGTVTLSGVISGGAGVPVTKIGGGTVSLSNINTFTGGMTVSAGTLTLANGGGSGAMRGSLNISSGATVNATTTDALGFNGGTSVTNLAINGGTFNIGGAGNQGYLAHVYLTGGTLSSSGGGAFNVNGVGINSLAATNTATISAPVVLRSTTITFTTAKGTVSDLTDLNVSGIISQNGGNYTIAKVGAGTLKLSAVNTYLGGTRANLGTLILAGGHTHSGTADYLLVNDIGAQNAVLKITAGAQGFYDMPIASAASSRGAVYQSGGVLTLNRGSSTDTFKVGSGVGAYGYYQLSGGTLTNVNEVGIGGLANGTVGVMDVNGGSLYSPGWLTIGRGGTTSSGILNVSGAGAIYLSSALDATRDFRLNFAGSSGAQSIVTVSGGGLIQGPLSGVGLSTYTLDLSNANVSGTLGAFNLNSGGTLQIFGINGQVANPTTLFNFNGGTLKATAANAAYTGSNIDGMYVYPNGGTFDNNGVAVTIGQALLAPTGNGVTSIAVTAGGSGYIGPPMVAITGGTGAPATAVANMVDDGTGNGTYAVSSFTITSPGSYSVNPTTVTLSGGGPGTAATVGAISTAANTSVGGMTIAGAGTTTLTSGASTYGGGTTLNTGTLLVGASTTGAVTSGPVGSGTLTLGTSTFGFSASGLTIANAIDVTGTVTIGQNANNTATLSGALTGSGTLQNYNSGVANTGDNLYFTGNLSGFTGTISFTDSSANSSAFWRVGATGGATVDLSGATLTLNAGSGTAKLFGFIDGITVANTLKLSILTGDGVFQGSYNGSGVYNTIEVGNGNANSTFTGVIGYTPNNMMLLNLTKVGSGSLTLSGASIYSGTTTLSAGQLNINYGGSSAANSAIGTGALTIGASGVILDNTSGGSVTLLPNNAQNWNADFTFAGSNPLNMGTGTATLGANVILTASANTLTVGKLAGSYGVTKAGAGTLLLGNGGASSISGDIGVTGGTLQIGINDLTSSAGGLTGSATVENGSGTTRWVIVNPSATKTFSGTLQDGGGVGDLGFYKGGAGTQILSGNNTYSSTTTLNAGFLQFNASSAMSATSPLAFNNGGGLALRADADTTFTPASISVNNDPSSGQDTTQFNIDVNQLSSGTSKTLTLSGGITFNPTSGSRGFDTSTISVTGGNGYTLSLGAVTGAANGAGSHQVMDVASGVNLKLASFTQPGGSNPGNVTFQGNGNTEVVGTISRATNRSLTVRKGGTGALTLTGGTADGGGANAFTFHLTNGTVNVNNATALRATVNLSCATSDITLDNTSGGAITLSTNPGQNWNGNIVFTGTTNLNLGTGGVTLNANVTLTANANTLTVGGGIGGSFGLTKDGAGTLVLNAASGYSGNTLITNGTLRLNVGGAGGTLTGNGSITIANGATLLGGVTDAVGYGNHGTGVNDVNIDQGGTLSVIAGQRISMDRDVNSVGGTIASADAGDANGAYTFRDSGSAVYSFTSASNGTPSTISSAGFGLQGAVTFNVADGNGAVDLDLTGTVINSFSAGTLIKTGAGTLTLSGANTHSGGTTLSAGGLNLDHATAPGSGTITIAGGTLDNTSGGAVTLSNNNAQNWNGDFAFTGTDDLNMGTGTATLGTNVVLTASANTLTVGKVAGSFGLTKGGAGMLTLGNGGASSISGDIGVTGGTLQIGLNDFTSSAGGLTGSGTVENGSGTTRAMIVTPVTTKTFSGTLQDGAGAGDLGFVKNGSGTQVLSGTNTLSSATTISVGTLQFDGTNAMSASSALSLSSGATLGLRSDTEATFVPASLGAFSPGSTYNFQVNSLNSPAGDGRTLTLNGQTGAGANLNTTINVSSTTGDTLKFGSASYHLSGNSGAAWGGNNNFFNLTGANVILNGMDDTAGNSDVLIVLASTTTNSLTVNGVVAANVNRTIGATVNSGVLTLNNTVTLSGANRGFYVNLNGGTLNLNNAGAINNNAAIGGPGNRAGFVIAGGNLGNTSGAAVTLSANPTIAFNGDFTFVGTNNLNIGTGSVTMSGDRQVTVNANTLTVGGAIGGGAYDLTKAGPGTLTLTGVNTYSGATLVSAGKLALASAGSITNSASLTVAAGATNQIAASVASQVLNTNAKVYLNSSGGVYGKMDLLSGTGQTVSELWLDGVPQAAGTWGPTGSGATHINNDYFSGGVPGGVLTVQHEGLYPLTIFKFN